MLHLKPRTEPEPLTLAPDWAAGFCRQEKEAQDKRLRSYYAAGVVDPETPLEEVPLVALDLETTGLDPQENGIVSIGLQPFRLAGIPCGQARHWVVDPRCDLSSKSVTLHRITHDDLTQAPDLEAHLSPLLEQLAGRVVVVHHRRIERHFLDAALRTRVGEGLLFPVLDTLDLEQRVLARQRNWLDLLLRRPLPSVRLADARARYHLPFYRPHHALSDALGTAELLLAQAAHNGWQQTPLKKLWK